jgi:hypothetical protein
VADLAAQGRLWERLPVMEELRAEARRQGLWNFRASRGNPPTQAPGTRGPNLTRPRWSRRARMICQTLFLQATRASRRNCV